MFEIGYVICEALGDFFLHLPMVERNLGAINLVLPVSHLVHFKSCLLQIEHDYLG